MNKTPKTKKEEVIKPPLPVKPVKNKMINLPYLKTKPPVEMGGLQENSTPSHYSSMSSKYSSSRRTNNNPLSLNKNISNISISSTSTNGQILTVDDFPTFISDGFREGDHD